MNGFFRKSLIYLVLLFFVFSTGYKSEKLIAQEKIKDEVQNSQDSTMLFSQEEIKWLKKNKVISYSEINWKPLSIIENNAMTGIMGDYLKIVALKTGIKFKFVPASSWPDVLDKFSKGEIDMVPGIGDSKAEKKLGLISDMYANYPMVIVANENVSYVHSLDEIKGKVFSIPKYYTSYNHIKNKYANAKIIETKSIPEALHNVMEKKADVFIGHLAPALYYITRLNATSLRVVGNADFDFRHHYLISPKHREFKSIVNKVFSSITEKEKEKIYYDWVHVEVKSKIDYTLIWQISIVALAIVILLIFNTKKLNSMVKTKTEEITLLLATYDRNVIATKTDKNGIITYASKAFCKISGYKQDELIGKSHNIMKHPDMAEGLFEDMWQTIKANIVWRGEMKNLKKDSGFYWSEVIISPEYNQKGAINGYSAIRQDITAKKALEDLSANLETKVDERTKELRKATKIISKSLDFASLIQKTFIWDENQIKPFFEDYFVVLKQKDVVGGDIIIFEKINETECLVMNIDCTSHGVPGAFVTMIVKTLARQIIEKIKTENFAISPSDILKKFNYEIKHLLNQMDTTAKSNVGFDGQILHYNKKTDSIKLASARNDMLIYNNKAFSRIRGDRHSVGYRDSDIDYPFKEHEFKIESDTIVYLYSDGFTDQLGGSKRIPFGFNKTIALLENCISYTMPEQEKYLMEGLSQYRGEQEQNDDLAFLGLKFKKS